MTEGGQGGKSYLGNVHIDGGGNNYKGASLKPHLIESCRVFERGYHGLTIEEERKIVEVQRRTMTASAQTNLFPNYKSWILLLQLIMIR